MNRHSLAMCSSIILFRYCCVLLVALSSSAVVEAQNSRQPLPLQPTPDDRIGLPFEFGGGCNTGRLDPARPPTISRNPVNPSPFPNTVSTYTVSIALVDDPRAVCGVLPPSPLRYLDIGTLPAGYHAFRLHISMNGAHLPERLLPTLQVITEPGMPEHVSGIWFDPQQGGRGVFITRSGYNHLSLVWFTHDAQGQPTWVLAADAIDSSRSEFVAAGVTTEGPGLAPGPAQLTQRPWGQLRLRYLKCDRAELEWDALDPAIVDGRIDLFRLTRADSAPTCAPEFTATALWQ